MNVCKKRVAVAAVCLVIGTGTAGAQWKYHYNYPEERSPIKGVNYHNFSRTAQTIDLAGKNTLVFLPALSGVAVTSGRSFLFHELPLFRIVHFGFDTRWYDIEYGKWLRKIDGYEKWMYKLDIGIGIGPAIHLSPTKRFGIHAYFHFTPTLSFVTHNFAGEEEGKFELVEGLAAYFSTGMSVSWRIFSLGAEYRRGGGTYRGIRVPDISLSLEDLEEVMDFRTKDLLNKQHHIMRGWRVYAGFRF